MTRDTYLFLAIMAGLLVLACVLWGTGCTEAVTLGWGASTGATGYKLYYGQAPGTYDVIMEVGAVLQAAVGGLTPGVVYYFAATAYNTTGESGYSNEVAWTEPIITPPPPIPAPPQIHIVSPLHGQAVERKSTILVIVALDAGGPLDWLDVMIDGLRLCRDLVSPYSCDWTVPPANRRLYRLQARAADTAGQIGLSSVVEVTSQ